MVLLGPNGAGKTTLFKILATLIQPDSGQAWVAGHPLTDALAVRRHIGMVADPDRSFFWRLNARQNLEFFASAYGLSSAQRSQRISEVLATLNLASLAGRPVGQLSSGQRGRLALARALVHRPLVLLLDEPTRSLDPTAAAHFHALLQQYLADNPAAAILLSTHRFDTVAAHCRRVLFLTEGCIRADGSPADLLAGIEANAGVSAAEDLARLYDHFTTAEPSA